MPKFDNLTSTQTAMFLVNNYSGPEGQDMFTALSALPVYGYEKKQFGPFTVEAEEEFLIGELRFTITDEIEPPS
jgi:hypothetical protein